MPNPLLLAAIPGVLGGISSWLSGNNASKDNRAQREWASEESQRQRAFDQMMAQWQQAQQDRQGALTAQNMDPLAQQSSRQRNALISSLVMNSTKPTMDNPGSGLHYNKEDVASFYSPEARAAAEQQFTRNARTATNNNYQGPSGDVGYGPGALDAGNDFRYESLNPGQMWQTNTAVPRYTLGGAYRPPTTDKRRPSAALQQLLSQGLD